MPEQHTTLTQTRHAFLIIAHHEPGVLRALLSFLIHFELRSEKEGHKQD